MGKLIFLIALLPAAAMAAEQPKRKAAPVTAANPCAQYGAGWVQVKGTTTCVKVSGSIGVEVGTSGRAR